ncbi:MAG: FAD:protein FMN transferase [Sneathiella sp.]
MKALNKSPKSLARRRFIVMAGAAGIIPFLGGVGEASNTLRPVKWQGSALGAEASIQLYHKDRVWAQKNLLRCQNEIARLENLFSLYRPQSEISKLNNQGSLVNPSIEFLTLLSDAMAFSKNSGGIFDVTVQPLWQLYATHFASPTADPEGPSQSEIDRILDLVGSDNIILDTNRISFKKAGMGVTLNGVAQGFITDRITDILKSAGFENVMVSLGENFALGSKPDGDDWRAGIISPVDGKSIAKTVTLKNKALATSGGYGSPFASNSVANHLLNPKTGKTAAFKSSVSVIADTATTADMVSTALCLMPKSAGENLVREMSEVDQVLYI